MKQDLINKMTMRIRICVTAFILVILSLFLFSFVATRKLEDEVWQQLGLNKQQGTESIYRSFTGGYLYYYQARNVKNIVGGNRVAVAKDLLAYARQYIGSDAFKKEYERERQSAKPSQPELKPFRTKAAIQKDEIAKAEKSLKEMEKNMKGMDAAMQKNLMPVTDMYKKLLKEYQDPDHPYFEGLMLYQESEKEQAIKSYEAHVKKWEKNYPADYMPVIKERLQKFLDVTSDVDFNAELKVSGRHKVFVNPAYEQKSREWKQAFRAGKEVSGVAREFVAQWLSGIK